MVEMNEKQNNEQQISENCFYVMSEEGNVLLMQLSVSSDSVICINVEPSTEIVDESEISDVIIVSNNITDNNGIVELLCPQNTNRFVFEATLGEISRSRDVPGQIQIVCECEAPTGSCVQMTTVSNGITTITCSSAIEHPCRSEWTLSQCVPKELHHNKNYEYTLATKMYLDCNKLWYNNVLYE